MPTDPSQSAEPNPSSIKSLKDWIAGWFLGLIGLLSLLVVLFGGNEYIELPWLVAIVWGWFSCVILSVIIHELAHFVVGHLFGLKPWLLNIGHGRIVFDRQFQTFRLILRANPYSGRVYNNLFPEKIQNNRWKEFAMIAAGPVSNAVLAAFSLLALFSPDSWGRFQIIPVALAILSANAYLLLIALVPNRAMREGTTPPNDGLLLTRLIFREQAGNKTAQTSQFPSYWKLFVNQIEPELLLDDVRRRLTDQSLSKEKRCFLLDFFSTFVLMQGLHDFLPEAARYSEELIHTKPDEWTIKGTRGSVLVEIGEIEAGKAMLQDLMEQDPSVSDRAISASFLALAELKNNNHQGAHEWIHRSRELAPDCTSMLRIEALLEQAKKVQSSEQSPSVRTAT